MWERESEERMKGREGRERETESKREGEKEIKREKGGRGSVRE